MSSFNNTLQNIKTPSISSVLMDDWIKNFRLEADCDTAKLFGNGPFVLSGDNFLEIESALIKVAEILHVGGKVRITVEKLPKTESS